jgi:hypothetical protein
MTEANFIALHFPQGQENIPGTIHLNVNPGPVVGDVTQGIITSMIITTNALSINGQDNNTYIEGVLEQIDSVKFMFNEQQYQLNIISRVYYPASNPFLYYVVEPVYIADIFDANQFIPSETEVTFTPYLQDIQFGFSQFNPLISNAEVNRKSNNKMTSDRLERAITPTNLDALLELTAEKASVQDSLYTDTGWVNARYNGSQTSAKESAGIAPTITGRTFTGEVFSSDSDTDYICALDNRVKQELFHTSDTALPTFNLSDVEVTLGQVFGAQQTRFTYSSIAAGSLEIGDVLKAPNPGIEYMKVENIQPNVNQVTVTRDIYNNYPLLPPQYIVGTIFTKIKRFDIFRFGTGQNRIQLVTNSRIYVEGNSTVVDTDDYGQILSSSQCPYIGYVVDQT